MQVVFAPFRNPPYAPSTMVHSPADVVECLCICLQILIVGCGIIGYTTRSVDDSWHETRPIHQSLTRWCAVCGRSVAADVVIVISALASILMPAGYVLYSRRVHRSWYELPEDDAKISEQDNSVDNPLRLDEPEPDAEAAEAQEAQDVAPT